MKRVDWQTGQVIFQWGKEPSWNIRLNRYRVIEIKTCQAVGSLINEDSYVRVFNAIDKPQFLCATRSSRVLQLVNNTLKRIKYREKLKISLNS